MRLFIADNQAKVRYALRISLEWNPDIRIIGEAGDTRTLEDKLTKSFPDLLVMDWMLSNNNPADLLSNIKAALPGMKIIILSSRPEHEAEALNAGADAFISKIEPPDKLMSAISEAYRLFSATPS